LLPAAAITVVKLAAEDWEGKPAVSPREFLASVRPVLGVLIVVSMNTQLRDERYRAYADVGISAIMLTPGLCGHVSGGWLWWG
jgi:hypothetical protein